jgi:hypothetical protein
MLTYYIQRGFKHADDSSIGDLYARHSYLAFQEQAMLR